MKQPILKTRLLMKGRPMTDNEKLAKALGLREDCTYGNSPGYQNTNGIRVCNSPQLEEYLNSPKGKKAVEKRVRELWKTSPGAYGVYGRREIVTRENVVSGAAIVELIEFDPTGPQGVEVDIRINIKPDDFRAASKPEAYAAALLWLAEQKGG